MRSHLGKRCSEFTDAAEGLLIAELTSDDIVVQAGSVFFFIIPGSLFVLVFFIGRPPRKAVEESLPHAHTGDASKEGEQDS